MTRLFKDWFVDYSNDMLSIGSSFILLLIATPTQILPCKSSLFSMTESYWQLVERGGQEIHLDQRTSVQWSNKQRRGKGLLTGVEAHVFTDSRERERSLLLLATTFRSRLLGPRNPRAQDIRWSTQQTFEGTALGESSVHIDFTGVSLQMTENRMFAQLQVDDVDGQLSTPVIQTQRSNTTYSRLIQLTDRAPMDQSSFTLSVLIPERFENIISGLEGFEDDLMHLPDIYPKGVPVVMLKQRLNKVHSGEKVHEFLLGRMVFNTIHERVEFHENSGERVFFYYAPYDGLIEGQQE